MGNCWMRNWTKMELGIGMRDCSVQMETVCKNKHNPISAESPTPDILKTSREVA